jgi:hypothetical protein
MDHNVLGGFICSICFYECDEHNKNELWTFKTPNYYVSVRYDKTYIAKIYQDGHYIILGKTVKLNLLLEPDIAEEDIDIYLAFQ